MGLTSKWSGFSIVELIVVFILLTVLLVTALPRFVEGSDELAQANYDGAIAALDTGLSLYHAQWQAADDSPPASAQFSFGGLRANHHGYPIGRGTAASLAILSGQDCVDIFIRLIAGGEKNDIRVSDMASSGQNNSRKSDLETEGDKTDPATRIKRSLGMRHRTVDFWADHSGPQSCRFVYAGLKVSADRTVPSISYDASTGMLVGGTYEIDGSG